MTNITKAKIDINAGIMELEGSEEFVTKYLEEFRGKLDAGATGKPAVQKKSVKRTSSHEKTKKLDASQYSRPKKRTKAPRIEMEEFAIIGDDENGIPSFKDFFNEKKPGVSAGARALVIGYYITHYLERQEFSEGNIEFAYKAMMLKNRPAHLRQIIINHKNDTGWFAKGSEAGKWKVERLGEIYVEDNLPIKEKGE